MAGAWDCRQGASSRLTCRAEPGQSLPHRHAAAACAWGRTTTPAHGCTPSPCRRRRLAWGSGEAADGQPLQKAVQVGTPDVSMQQLQLYRWARLTHSSCNCTVAVQTRVGRVAGRPSVPGGLQACLRLAAQARAGCAHAHQAACLHTREARLTLCLHLCSAAMRTRCAGRCTWRRRCSTFTSPAQQSSTAT